MNLTRRELLIGTAFTLHAADSPWIDLFDGKTLNGWTPSEHQGGWKVSGGKLTFDGDRSHLFYTGSNSFKNFELEARVFTQPLCNSGIFFHTEFQEKGFPVKGFEVQINNTAAGEGNYRERKKKIGRAHV